MLKSLDTTQGGKIATEFQENNFISLNTKFSMTLLISLVMIRRQLRLGALAPMHAKPLQSCPTVWDPLDCTLPVSSVHGISQARMLEGVAISSSRGSARHWGQTRVSCVSSIGRQILYCWTTEEVPHRWKFQFCHLCLKRKRTDTWPTGGQETETIWTESGLRPQCFRSHRLWPLIEHKFSPTLR